MELPGNPGHLMCLVFGMHAIFLRGLSTSHKVDLLFVATTELGTLSGGRDNVLGLGVSERGTSHTCRAVVATSTCMHGPQFKHPAVGKTKSKKIVDSGPCSSKKHKG